MKSLRAAATLFAVLALPAVSAAGPVQFSLGPGDVTATPWTPALGMALVPIRPPGPVYTFDPASGDPATIPVVGYDPTRLPPPAPRDVHPDGTTHWNNDGFFGVDVTLRDFASGESAVLHFEGRAHMYNQYSAGAGWSGSTDFWFQQLATATLGGNDYTVWGANQYDGGPAALNVWVGPDAPAFAAPEPGTAALAALGLVPLGLRRLRRGAGAELTAEGAGRKTMTESRGRTAVLFSVFPPCPPRPPRLI